MSSTFTGGLTGPAFVDVYQAPGSVYQAAAGSVTNNKQESSSKYLNTPAAEPTGLSDQIDSKVQAISSEEQGEGGVKGKDETRTPVPDLGLEKSKVTEDKSLNKDQVGKEVRLRL